MQCGRLSRLACSRAFRVFNLANTVPDGLAVAVKLAVNDTIAQAAEALERSPNTARAQLLLSVASPAHYHGLAGGWVFELLTDANRERVRTHICRKFPLSAPD